MIKRIVLLKLHDAAMPEERLAEFRAKTSVAFAAIPQVQSVHVSHTLEGDSRRSWDLMLEVVFRTAEEVEDYIVHPKHRAYVNEVLQPIVAFKKAWNFQS